MEVYRYSYKSYSTWWTIQAQETVWLDSPQELKQLDNLCNGQWTHLTGQSVLENPHKLTRLNNLWSQQPPSHLMFLIRLSFKHHLCNYWVSPHGRNDTLNVQIQAAHLDRFKVGHLWFEGGTNPPVQLNDQLFGFLSHILVTIIQQLWEELQQWFHQDHFGPKVSATHRCAHLQFST